MVKMNPKNLLIMYSGGGYDGCIWEWNFCLFDKDGLFVNVASSGYSGIEEEKTAVSRFPQLFEGQFSDPDENIENQELKQSDGRETFYTCRYTIDEKLMYFLEAMNEGLSLSVARWLDEHTPVSPVLTCGKCGHAFDVEEINVDDQNYTGDGGIGVVYRALICLDCYYDREQEEAFNYIQEWLEENSYPHDKTTANNVHEEIGHNDIIDGLIEKAVLKLALKKVSGTEVV